MGAGISRERKLSGDESTVRRKRIWRIELPIGRREAEYLAGEMGKEKVREDWGEGFARPYTEGTVKKKLSVAYGTPLLRILYLYSDK